MVRSMRGSVVVMVVVAAVVVCSWGNVQMASADTSPSQCKEERNLLVNACRPVIYGRSPSANCCQRVRVSHAECVCPYVTPKTASIIGAIGVDNVVKKIEGCGRTVPRKFKCGSKLLLYGTPSPEKEKSFGVASFGSLQNFPFTNTGKQQRY